MTNLVLHVSDNRYFVQYHNGMITGKNGLDVYNCHTAAGALKLIDEGILQRADVCVIRQDLGKNSLEYNPDGRPLWQAVAAKIHLTNKRVRVGILGGMDLQDGKQQVIKSGIDFYLPESGINYNSEWYLQQLQKGPVGDSELVLRGKETASPYGFLVSRECMC